MSTYPVPSGNQRIGFHYYPDTNHYRASDLQRWLPELKGLGAQWLTLVAPTQVAIPETFIRGLVQAGIEPVLHFPFSLDAPPSPSEIKVLFEAYKNWGVHYVALFDKPNMQAQWNSQSWTQEDLVSRFLDIFLPLAETAVETGLSPVFAPLEPGGDFWDTTFLRTALQEFQQRNLSQLLDKLVIGVYAWAHNLPLNWGAGGPERWPGTRPYQTPPGEEDQRGFRIFDWYSAISQSVLGRSLPVLMLACGSRPGDQLNTELPAVDDHEHGQRNLQLARLLAGEADTTRDGVVLDAIPDNVLAGNFWLLATENDSEYADQAWYGAGFDTLPAVQDFQAWMHERKLTTGGKTYAPAAPAPQVTNKQAAEPEFIPQPQAVDAPVQPDLIKSPVIEAQAPHRIPAQPIITTPPPVPEIPPVPASPVGTFKSTVNGSPAARIEHYVLLPAYEWGVADWHLEVIRPYVKKYHPTVGFSIDEAKQARKVTVVGGRESFPADIAQTLASQGCEVIQIEGDGTSIASQLKTL